MAGSGRPAVAPEELQNRAGGLVWRWRRWRLRAWRRKLRRRELILALFKKYPHGGVIVLDPEVARRGV